MPRRGRACSCFVDRSRGGLSGNAPAQPWQHKQTSKTVSRHKPRYHVSHDAIHRGKTSRCPLAEQLLFHPPLILPQIRSHQSVCCIPGWRVVTSRSVEPKATEGNVKAGTRARMSEVAPPPPPPPYSSHLSCLSSAAQVALVSCWGESRLTQRISQWAGLPQSSSQPTRLLSQLQLLVSASV